LFEEEEETILHRIANLYTSMYQPIIENLANAINKIALLLPRRRARKLHIGLFGYSRSTGKVTLPRAISFTGALYSLGIPPELIGISSLSQLNEKEWSLFEKSYKYYKHDLQTAARFVNFEGLDLAKEIWKIDEGTMKRIKEDLSYAENVLGIKVGDSNSIGRKHALMSSLALIAIKEGNIEEAKSYLLEIAKIRRSLG